MNSLGGEKVRKVWGMSPALDTAGLGARACAWSCWDHVDLKQPAPAAVEAPSLPSSPPGTVFLPKTMQSHHGLPMAQLVQALSLWVTCTRCPDS